jgi:dTDP-4-amino-4,6-dideoxygalactose transaminase
VSEKIPLSRVHQSEAIDRRILQIIRSGNYILGPECSAFEEELAAFVGVKHAVLASSCTMAVYLLHLTQKLQKGDEVLIPSLTAFPSVEPLIHAGATPVFCDIDETYNIDLADAQKRITKKTVGILPVHLYGRPNDMDALAKFAADHNLWILEDCAQAIGAKWKGQRVGSFGQHAAVSFYPSKNLTVYGDGGALLTNDSSAADQVRMFRNHGRKDKYLHEKVGFNLRFNEIQAAVGREQLKVIDDLNAARAKLADQYRLELAAIPAVSLPPADARTGENVYHMFVIRLADHDRRQSLARHLKEKGIETGVHYPVPIHLQPAIEDRFGKQPALPRTEKFVKCILSLPIFPAMAHPQVAAVAREIRDFAARQ